MQKLLRIPNTDVIPSVGAVLESQGIPSWRQPDERIKLLAQEAFVLYREKADPICIFTEISKNDFEILFTGDGLNEDESPVHPIFQSSENLALFAVTIGKNVCEEISKLFGTNDFALGWMLDSTASVGTEMTAEALENSFRKLLQETNRYDARTGILRFSPGYCGWHISGQKKLFEHLLPEKIGITLNESFLMQPIKSISGVIISGHKEIFNFEDVFAFCRDCTTHTCRDRIKSVLEQ
jgi:hypothetical protein